MHARTYAPSYSLSLSLTHSLSHSLSVTHTHTHIHTANEGNKPGQLEGEQCSDAEDVASSNRQESAPRCPPRLPSAAGPNPEPLHRVPRSRSAGTSSMAVWGVAWGVGVGGLGGGGLEWGGGDREYRCGAGWGVGLALYHWVLIAGGCRGSGVGDKALHPQPSPLTPHPSPLTPHPSPLTLSPSPLTPQLSH
jgi:hypothetical protein